MTKYDQCNIFSRIIRGEIPSKMVYQDEFVVAIEDINPAGPVHVLVMPRGEYTSFDDFVTKAPEGLIARFFKTVQRIAEQLGVRESGYRLIANHGKHASQSVPHFHVHLIGGRSLGGLVPGDGESR
ncbi:MAG: histidine triad nucleotide-binding protein [Alphaproteobacteria bacterium]|nr:histidine triad nucleotide-binding protein [Alphaproteobacteria bacterium]